MGETGVLIASAFAARRDRKALDSVGAAVWAPDGERVAFSRTRGAEAGLWIWDLRTYGWNGWAACSWAPFFGFQPPR